MAATDRVNLIPGDNFRVWTVTTGSAAQLAAMPCIGVLLRAPTTNTTGVQISYANGFGAGTFGTLLPGESVSLDINDTSKIWTKAASATPTLEVWALLRS